MTPRADAPLPCDPEFAATVAKAVMRARFLWRMSHPLEEWDNRGCSDASGSA